ncbi:exodeoxyribonuclease iii [Stylonychia lemnae]|uniref:Exodeoxyribonuclease iii n=1 Tax=Stylonychia lemnae TaxID=5949 RepID=A0A078AU63_STYLE|nr:exodeoxyribonuclease iii [Stylonychia lemnae]|eukprot:CDW85526.1 exodeoxyribonuclease iii [Stylonychia lemnae]
MSSKKLTKKRELLIEEENKESNLKIDSKQTLSRQQTNKTQQNLAKFFGILQKCMEKDKPDIICFNDMKTDKNINLSDQLHHSLPEGYEQYWNCSKVQKGHAGAGLVTRIKPLSVQFEFEMEKHQDEGSMITAEFKNFTLIIVHLPIAGKDLSSDFQSFQDWNKDFFEYLDKIRIIKQKPLILAGYVDAFKHLHPEKREQAYLSSVYKDAMACNKDQRNDNFILHKDDLDFVVDSIIHQKYSGSNNAHIEEPDQKQEFHPQDNVQDKKEEIIVNTNAKEETQNFEIDIEKEEEQKFNQLVENEVQRRLNQVISILGKIGQDTIWAEKNVMAGRIRQIVFDQFSQQKAKQVKNKEEGNQVPQWDDDYKIYDEEF